MAVYEPSLMLQQGGAIAAQYGYWTEFVYVVFKAGVVVAMSGVAAIGHLFTRTTLAERVLAGIAAALIMGSFPWSDESGLAIAAAVRLMNWLRARKTRLAAPAST